MSYSIVWEFLAPRHRIADFKAAYGPAGDWASLFARAECFVEIQLLRSTEHDGRYLTIDRWTSQDAFEAGAFTQD
jgi:heme-degrading monooxygenase HmoA